MNKVFVIDEDSGEKVANCATIQAAEAWIAEMEKINPAKVYAGGFGIDYPEDMDADYQASRAQET